MEREKKKVETFGVLTILNGVDDNFVYFLLAARPVNEFDSWIDDNERCFYVCDFMQNKPAEAKFIVVRGNYIIDFRETPDVEIWDGKKEDLENEDELDDEEFPF